MERSAVKNSIPTRHHFDFPLFAAILVICVFGLVMLYSASYYYAENKFGSGTYFLKRQLIFFGIGLGAMLALSYFNFKNLQKLTWIGYAVVGALLLATALFGVKVNGARRWINIAGFQFQPSELAKITIVIVLSTVMCYKRVHMQSLIQGIGWCILVLVPYVILILMQPNFSLVIILALITYVMFYLGGTRLSHRFLLLVTGLILGGIAIALVGYRSVRIRAWIDPYSDPNGAGYQIIQSRIALGNGGFLGQGLNFSKQKLLFLPERENDYILAIIGEELGFVGCFLLLAAYFFVIYRGILIAMRCRDRFGRLLAGGITSVIGIQVLLNVCVVTNATPSTGQTLPFVSYGGTSLIVFMAAIGILLNISRYTGEDFGTEETEKANE